MAAIAEHFVKNVRACIKYQNIRQLRSQTFELGAAYSGELLSLNKMLGSLQDAGNTATLAGYINLLGESGMLRGLQKFSIDTARRKASIPKLQVGNNALKMVYSPLTFMQAPP